MDPITFPGTSTAGLALADKAQQSAAAAETNAQTRLEKDTKLKEKKKEYYMNVDGGKYHFPDGTSATFEHGVYATDSPYEIEELDKVLKAKGQFLITAERQEVIQSDALILREVPQGSGTPVQGTVSTRSILPR